MAAEALVYHSHQVHYLRRQVAYNSTPTNTIRRFSMGTLPAGAQIMFGTAVVKTGFSAAGTRVLTVGSNGTTADNMLATIAEETATTAQFLTAATRLTFASDTEVFVKLTTAGTAAAAGLAEVWIGYAPAAAS
jgi:hypothetical protein